MSQPSPPTWPAGIVPAICPNGHAFPSGILLGPHASGTITGSKAGPCPACGLMGSIPDGTWTVGTIRALLGLNRSDLQRVRGVVNQVRGDPSTPASAAQIAALPRPAAQMVLQALNSPHKTRLGLLALALAIILWMFPKTGDQLGQDVTHAIAAVVHAMTEGDAAKRPPALPTPGGRPPSQRKGQQYDQRPRKPHKLRRDRRRKG